MYKKIFVSFIVVIAIVAAAGIVLFKTEAGASQFIISRDAAVETGDDGLVTVSFSVTGTGKAERLGAGEIRLYSYDGGLLKTFSYTDEGMECMMGEDTGKYSGSVTYNGDPEELYYAEVTFYAVNKGETETAEYTTMERKADYMSQTAKLMLVYDCGADGVNITDEIVYYPVKNPVVINTADGTEYELLLKSAEGGEIVYCLESDVLDLDENNLEVVSPILYIKRESEEITIPLSSGGSEMISFEVEDGNRISFTVADDTCIPDMMSVIYDGNEYEPSGGYVFDNATGKFKYGYCIYGLALVNVIDDAYLTTSMFLEKYSPEIYSITMITE